MGPQEWRPGSPAPGPERPPSVSPPFPPVGTPGATPDQPTPDGPAPEARRRQGTIGWDILLGLDFAFIAFNLVVGIIAYFQWLAGGDDPNAVLRDISDTAFRVTMFLLTGLNLVMFGLIPFAWVWGTRVGGFAGAVRYLHLARPWPAIGMGVPLAMALVVLAIGVAYLAELAGLLEPTPNSEAITRALNWPLAIFISLVAGFSEEILFRGVLQRWLGVWGQAALFGLFHLANGIVGLVVTTLIGLTFGLLVAKRRSLWLVISAHVVYDLILLAAALLFPEFAEPQESFVLRLF